MVSNLTPLLWNLRQIAIGVKCVRRVERHGVAKVSRAVESLNRWTVDETVHLAWKLSLRLWLSCSLTLALWANSFPHDHYTLSWILMSSSSLLLSFLTWHASHLKAVLLLCGGGSVVPNTCTAIMHWPEATRLYLTSTSSLSSNTFSTENCKQTDVYHTLAKHTPQR